MTKKITILVSIISMAILTTISIDYNITKNVNGSLLLSNIEALAWDGKGGTEGNPSNYQDCLRAGGNWNMASVCTETGFESSTCRISGEISLFGVTIKGNYEKGKTYSIPWARYTCQPSEGNCCVKQGLYSGSQKLA